MTPCLCTAVAERAIEDTLLAFGKGVRRAFWGFTSNMASRHVVVEHGDPSRENIKNAWNWESEEVGEEEGKKERVGLHVRKIAEPGIVYCTVCDRIINYTNRGKDALTADWSSITDWMDAIKYHEVLSFLSVILWIGGCVCERERER